MSVTSVGQFTIPLMIKFGYRRSLGCRRRGHRQMGGQIMPR